MPYRAITTLCSSFTGSKPQGRNKLTTSPDALIANQYIERDTRAEFIRPPGVIRDNRPRRR